MSLFDCIQTGIDGGEIERTRGQNAQDLFNNIRRNYASNMGEDAANAAAAEDVRRIMREQTLRRRRLVRIQLQGARRLTRDILQHRRTDGVLDAGAALPGLLEKGNHNFQSVREVRETLTSRYHRLMVDGLIHFGRNVVGEVRNKADMMNVVRALHGREVADQSASEIAAGFQAAMAQARRDYNAAGGDIGEIEDWGLPHRHSRDKMLDAGRERWIAEVHGRLDWSRMIDFETGQPFAIAGGAPPPGRADSLLREIFEGKTTDGWDTREPNFQRAGLALANRRSDARVLHFKSPEDWFAYNEQFGESDPFTAIVSHLDGMARDTALMRVLTPNPKAGLEFAIQVAEKQAQTAPWPVGSTHRHALDKLRGDAHLARMMFELTTGEANRPVNGLMANFLSGTRHVLVGAQLGAATISAISDVGFQYAAAREIGIDPFKVVGRIGKDVFKGRDAQQALRMGVIADQLANVGAAQARYVGEDFAPEIATRISDGVLRLSGLSRWTSLGRHSFQLEFMGMLADHVAHGFDELPDPLRNLFDRHGLTAEEWDAVRATEVFRDPNGASFLIPDDVRFREDLPEGRADSLALKLGGIMHTETRFAVPSTTTRGRAMFSANTQPGTFAGELLRSGLMYKSFGMTVVFDQTQRIMQQGTNWNKAIYAGKLFASLSLMGAVSIQMKELSKGRDPRPMDSRSFIAAAILQGGGFGIFGDFFSAAENRFGGGFGETLSGPVFGAAGDLASLGIEAGRAVLGDDDTRVGRHSVDFVRQYAPGASLWYLALALQRYGFDQLQMAVDPDARKALRARERRRVKKYGNESWWRPGDTAPDRAPEFGGIIQ